MESTSQTLPKAISIILKRTIAQNEESIYKKNTKSEFEIEFKYKIKILELLSSVSDYIKYLLKYLDIEPSTLSIALIYLDKAHLSGLYLTKNNFHLLLYTACIVAVKYNEDHIFSDLNLAKVLGLPMKDLLKSRKLF